MSNIKVSVVIPFYSQVNWLIEAVDSVFNQTYTNFEIIVINDGSKDDISLFLNKFQDKVKYKWKENGGPGSARNLGIELSNGEYIAFLDSDDIWTNKKLEMQVNLMDQSGAIWSHTYWAQFANDDVNEIIRTYDSENKKNTYPGSLASTNIATPCVMIRTDYIKNRIDLRFNEQMRYGQDNYLWLLLSLEHDIELVPQILSKVRLTGNNTVKRARAHIEVRGMIWKYLGQDKSGVFYRSHALAGIRCIYRFCLFEHHFLNWLEKRSWINNTFVEIMAKIIYMIPYTGFKLFKKILK
jgi:glycosyltransferase involved in cell wall biosynthesis